MPLLNEGVDVWAPVDVAKVNDDTYIVLSRGYRPDDEDWQFVPGTIVRCVWRKLSGEPEDVLTVSSEVPEINHWQV